MQQGAAEKLIRVLQKAKAEKGVSAKKAFLFFHNDLNGFITKRELNSKLIEIEISQSVEDEVWDAFDASQPSGISFNDFTAFMPRSYST